LKRYCTLRLCSPKKLVFKKNFVFFDKLRFEKQRYFLSTGLRFSEGKANSASLPFFAFGEEGESLPCAKRGREGQACASR
jgi:hypothetical protein